MLCHLLSKYFAYTFEIDGNYVDDNNNYQHNYYCRHNYNKIISVDNPSIDNDVTDITFIIVLFRFIIALDAINFLFFNNY